MSVTTLAATSCKTQWKPVEKLQFLTGGTATAGAAHFPEQMSFRDSSSETWNVLGFQLKHLSLLFLGASKTGTYRRTKLPRTNMRHVFLAGWTLVDHRSRLQMLRSAEDLRAAELITEVTGCRLGGQIDYRKWDDKCSLQTRRNGTRASLKQSSCCSWSSDLPCFPLVKWPDYHVLLILND